MKLRNGAGLLLQPRVLTTPESARGCAMGYWNWPSDTQKEVMSLPTQESLWKQSASNGTAQTSYTVEYEICHLGPGTNTISPFYRPFSRWAWFSRCLLKQRMMEVVVTTGAISRAKLQSNCHHQQTKTQLFTDRMPFLSPNQHCQSTEGKNEMKD